MDDGTLTPQLVAWLDITQEPPVVVGVDIRYNIQHRHDPAQAQYPAAIITQVTGFNRNEALRAMGALIWTDPAYEWVILRYGNEDDLIRLHPDNYGKDMIQWGFTYAQWRVWRDSKKTA